MICSSLIARLFQRVRFPILPTVSFPEDSASEPRGRLVRRIFGQPGPEYTGIFRMRHPTLVTPRDFDLSPFFDIVKQNPVARGDFDYSRIQWADEPESSRSVPELSLPKTADGES